MGIYKNINKSQTPLLDTILHDKCISRGEAMKELNVTRSHYYSKLKDEACDGFIKKHENDWTFDPEKLLNAIGKSGDTQKGIAEKLGIHNVTLNIFLKGKQRPTRQTKHYFIIEGFCKKWFCY